MEPDSAETRLTNLLSKIATAEELAGKNLYREEEYASLSADIQQALSEVLPQDSEIQREYDRERRLTRWHEQTHTGFLDTRHIGDILFWRSFIVKAIEALGGAVPVNQQVIPAGDTFTARQALRKVMSEAKGTITIFDEYLDDAEVLNIIEPYVKNGVVVRLLKASPSNAFKSDVATMRKQYGNHVELRDYVTKCHDRFVVIDGAAVYAFGASLKDMGTKVTVINKLGDTDATKYVAMFDAWWAAATVIY
jgi:hypothetical protein